MKYVRIYIINIIYICIILNSWILSCKTASKRNRNILKSYKNLQIMNKSIQTCARKIHSNILTCCRWWFMNYFCNFYSWHPPHSICNSTPLNPLHNSSSPSPPSLIFPYVPYCSPSFQYLQINNFVNFENESTAAYYLSWSRITQNMLH